MKKWLMAGAALMTLAAGTAPVSAQTLREALATAYENNPTLAAERDRLRSVNEQVPQALSGWRPSVTLSGGAGAATSDSNITGTWKTQHLRQRTVDLNLTQPVYNGGGTVAATSAAEESVLAERARLTTTEQQVLLNAATAYLDVLRDESVLKLQINNENVLRHQLAATQDQFRVGEVTRTDVAQAESRLEQAIADRIQAEGNLQISRESYRAAIGVAPGTLEAPPQKMVALPKSRGGAIEAAVADNPSVVAAKHDEASAKKNVDVNTAQLLPSVALVGDLNQSDDSLYQSTRTKEASVMAKVSIPLYESGAVYSRVRQARASANQAAQQVDVARRSAVNSAGAAWENLQTAQARKASIISQIRAAEIALEGVRREAEVGSRTTLDVLNAEQEALNARVQLVIAQHDEDLARFQLASAVGEFTAARLKLPVKVYNPVADYSAVRNKWFGTRLPTK